MKSLVLEAAIFISHLVWLFRTRKIRKAAKQDGKTFDDIAQEYADQDIHFTFSERKFRVKEKDVELKSESPTEADQAPQVSYPERLPLQAHED